MFQELGTHLQLTASKNFTRSFSYPSPLFLLIILVECRNQTTCSYNDKQAVCKQSKGYKAIPQSWWILMFPLTYMFTVWIMP